MTHKQTPFSTLQYGYLPIAAAIDPLGAGKGASWTVVAVDVTVTSAFRTHNAGLVSDKYGRVPRAMEQGGNHPRYLRGKSHGDVNGLSGLLTVATAAGWPSALWSYKPAVAVLPGVLSSTRPSHIVNSSPPDPNFIAQRNL